MPDTDLLIVGAGPAGLFACFYAGLRGLRVTLLDSAVDWANTLVGHARSVTLVHRRKHFRAHARSLAALHASNAEVFVNCQVTAVHGQDSLEGVTIGATTYRRADVLIPALGHTASLGPLRNWGIGIRDRHIEVGTDMATCIDRVYAAGDVTDYPGKVRLRPDQDLFPGHSTERNMSWPT